MATRTRRTTKERDIAGVLDETARSLFQQSEALRRQAQDLVNESRTLRAAARQRRQSEEEHKRLLSNSRDGKKGRRTDADTPR